MSLEKKIVFGEQEWLDAFLKNIEESKEYAEAAKNWEGDFVFVFTPDGTGNFAEERKLYMDLWHGACREAYYLSEDNPGPDKVEYKFQGKYTNWLKVFNKELDPLKGILQRKFKVKCGAKAMAKLLRATNAAKKLVMCTQIENVEYP